MLYGWHRALRLGTLVCCAFAPPVVLSQAAPSAVRQIDLTGFAGITAIYTGLNGSHNGAVTAGLDLNLPEFARVRPALELRCTYPYAPGSVIAEKSLLAGFRIEARLNTVHPYVDFLAGPGDITFQHPYIRFDGTFIQSQPRTTVLSPGIGMRLDLLPRLSVFADLQAQRWSTPASLSGHLFAKPVTVGLVYRFPLTSSRVR